MAQEAMETRVRGVENRVLVIETALQQLATKSWVLGGVVGGMVLAASLARAVVKLFPLIPQSGRGAFPRDDDRLTASRHQKGEGTSPLLFACALLIGSVHPSQKKRDLNLTPWAIMPRMRTAGSGRKGVSVKMTTVLAHQQVRQIQRCVDLFAGP